MVLVLVLVLVLVILLRVDPSPGTRRGARPWPISAWWAGAGGQSSEETCHGALEWVKGLTRSCRVIHSVMASVHNTKVRLLVASFTALFTVSWRLFTRRKCDCLSRRSQTVYNTKGTRAHTHREVIRKWLWEPKGSVHSIMVSVHRNKETKP